MNKKIVNLLHLKCVIQFELFLMQVVLMSQTVKYIFKYLIAINDVKGDSIISSKNYNNSIREFHVKFKKMTTKETFLYPETAKGIKIVESSLHHSYSEEQAYSDYSQEEIALSEARNTDSLLEEEQQNLFHKMLLVNVKLQVD